MRYWLLSFLFGLSAHADYDISIIDYDAKMVQIIVHDDVGKVITQGLVLKKIMENEKVLDDIVRQIIEKSK